MNQSKTLAIVTTRFPYGYGETFLETEIQFLSRKFDRIVILPEIRTDRIRPLPENVYVDSSYSEWSSRTVFRVLGNVCSKNFYDVLWRCRKKIGSVKDLIWIFKFTSNQIVWNKVFSKNSSLREVDIFYTYWLTSSATSLLRLKMAKAFFSKIVSRAHRYDVYEGVPDTPKFWPERIFTINNLDSIYTISEDAKDYLLKRNTLNNNVRVSRLGVTDKGFISHSSSSGNMCIVSVSRMAPMKRVDFIKDCIKEFAIRHKNINITWTHFGGGDQLERFRLEADSMRVGNLNVNFKGVVKNEDVYAFYTSNTVDAFINLSSSEGIPVSIMEAQSFGIPCVATAVGGNREIVTKSTGVIVEDIDSIEEVLAGLFLVYGKKFSHEEVKATWCKKYNADTNYNGFVDDLNLLLKN